jgi:hypothetical protein
MRGTGVNRRFVWPGHRRTTLVAVSRQVGAADRRFTKSVCVPGECLPPSPGNATNPGDLPSRPAPYVPRSKFLRNRLAIRGTPTCFAWPLLSSRSPALESLDVEMTSMARHRSPVSRPEGGAPPFCATASVPWFIAQIAACVRF